MTPTVSHVERIAAHQYVFLSEWHLPFDQPAVFAVLRDLWSYPQWWPEFKQADQISADEGTFALRGPLPLTLKFNLTREFEDESRGILRARASGDITGEVEWRVVQTAPQMTVAHFSENVTLDHRLARRIDMVVRPLLRLNHWAAMRSGQSGLLVRLATVVPPT